ncbi:MAG: dethiobiotin synthase [Candidatus Omnitrophica bacterium]|nr:dethiobiotin synthase [Candidatus Omnitrophota bacterium]
MRGIFVTGTDTGVGKTIVTGLLAKFLDDKGYKVITQKWVETGSVGFSKDVSFHLKLIGKRKQELKGHLSDIFPYTFKFPSSPHLASALEKRNININKIKKSFKSLQRAFDFVVVEGVGGILVPLNKKRLVVDIVKELKLPVVVVVGNKLGAINHTLLTIEALKARKMKIAGIVFNSLSNKENSIILKDNPKIIETISGQKILGSLPYTKDVNGLHKIFPPIARKILSRVQA